MLVSLTLNATVQSLYEQGWLLSNIAHPLMDVGDGDFVVPDSSNLPRCALGGGHLPLVVFVYPPHAYGPSSSPPHCDADRRHRITRQDHPGGTTPPAASLPSCQRTQFVVSAQSLLQVMPPGQ